MGTVGVSRKIVYCFDRVLIFNVALYLFSQDAHRSSHPPRCLGFTTLGWRQEELRSKASRRDEIHLRAKGLALLMAHPAALRLLVRRRATRRTPKEGHPPPPTMRVLVDQVIGVRREGRLAADRHRALIERIRIGIRSSGRGDLPPVLPHPVKGHRLIRPPRRLAPGPLDQQAMTSWLLRPRRTIQHLRRASL